MADNRPWMEPTPVEKYLLVPVDNGVALYEDATIVEVDEPEGIMTRPGHDDQLPLGPMLDLPMEGGKNPPPSVGGKT